MNFNNILKENEKAEKQIDKFIEEKESISNIEKLEERTEKTIKLLNQFYESVLSMIKRMEKAGKYMEIESIQKIFITLSNNTEILIKNQEKMENVISNFSTNGTKIFEYSNHLIKKKLHFFRCINWFLAMVVIIFSVVAFNIFNKIDNYERKLGSYFVDVHNILKEEEKYWYDEKNKNIYLKNINKK